MAEASGEGEGAGALSDGGGGELKACLNEACEEGDEGGGDEDEGEPSGELCEGREEDVLGVLERGEAPGGVSECGEGV